MKIDGNNMIRSQQLIYLLCVCFGLIPPALAASDPVDSVAQKVEKRVDAAEKADALLLDSTKSRQDYYLNREYAINHVLLKQAKEARDKGEFDHARALYQRVLTIAPNNQYAASGLNNLARAESQQKVLDKAKALMDKQDFSMAKDLVHDVLLENPQHKQAKQLYDQINFRLGDTNARAPKLKPKFNKPVTLELRNADLKLAFDTLSRDTGVNFILDKDIRKGTKANIFVKNLPIEEAIDMVISSNGLAKKIVSENTVIVYPNNKVKQKAYEELLIRNFYLNNTKAKDVAAMLKSMIKTKNVFVYERLNMLMVRDRPEVINLAEKLVASIDLEDPEVMLEIEVLEVSVSRAQQLGIVFPSQLSVLSANAALTLASLEDVNRSRIGVSANPALNFGKQVGDLNLLSNPRIRVKNNEKAKIMVGDKVPVITTTSTANVGISESVSYVDVGLKLEVEPRITLDDFVNIKVGLEVSTLGERTVTANGTSVFQIGSRNAQTALRLKDGETQILAGLILDDERKTASKLPGLGDIPLLGRLFANNDTSKDKTEIVLAITPRILGNIPLPKAQNSEYWSGTTNQVSDRIQKTTAVNGSGNGGTPPAFGQSTNAFQRLLEQRRQREAQAVPLQPVVPDIDPANVPPVPEAMKEAGFIPENTRQINGTPPANGSAKKTNEALQTDKVPDETFIPGIQVFP